MIKCNQDSSKVVNSNNGGQFCGVKKSLLRCSGKIPNSVGKDHIIVSNYTQRLHLHANKDFEKFR